MRITMLILAAVALPQLAAAQSPPAASAALSCRADAEKQKTSADFEKGVAELRAEAARINTNAEEAAKLVLKLREWVARCEPGYGPQVVQAIDRRNQDGKNLIDQLQDLGARSKAAGDNMATAVDSASTRYKDLSFCDVNACSGAFSALGGIFTPVSAQAKVSYGSLKELRERYIIPTKTTLEARRHDIEYVLSGPNCTHSRANYQKAMQYWEQVQIDFQSLQERIGRHYAVANSIAQSGTRATSCTVAGR